MSGSDTPQASSSTHPLQFKWTLWHDVANKGKASSANFAANLREIASFDTVEDFWALFNNLKEPLQLPIGNTYNLFKYGIAPKWEDPQNNAGGEWRVTVTPSRNQSGRPPSSRPLLSLDEYWVNTVLAVIGEGFAADESDDIAGIVLNVRKGNNRIALWTKNALNEDLQLRIARRWRETANIQIQMEYTSFKDALLASGNRRASARYIVK